MKKILFFVFIAAVVAVPAFAGKAGQGQQFTVTAPATTTSLLEGWAIGGRGGVVGDTDSLAMTAHRRPPPPKGPPPRPRPPRDRASQPFGWEMVVLKTIISW